MVQQTTLEVVQWGGPSLDHMTSRFDLVRTWPEGYQAQSALSGAVAASGLDHALLELVKMRASQLNGCAYCLDMHSKDARAAGETEQRLHTLAGWRETPFFTPAERAALALTEQLTLLADGHPTDGVVEEVRAQLGEEGLVQLTFAIVAINGWNRLAITARLPVGHHQPAARANA
ncbi:MAG: carboxymuconolactone decarboxylase [Actinomycetia bacterium]|nr:carboxymuconolactone decarboxylase [Actinomycetes bacterium]